MRVLSLHMQMGVVKRSSGMSAVKAAAYISGEKLRDERTGINHDYSGRDGVERTGIALGEDAPDEAADRSWLWNEAEANETRVNSRTARRIIINKPHEFDDRLRAESDLRIAQLFADRYGAADYAAHAPDAHGDSRNFHTHFLIPTRKFDNGQWAAKKDRILDDRKSGPLEIRQLRADIAAIMNEIAVRENLPIFVEHLSFKDRGIEDEPTKHMGPVASQKERLGQVTDIGEYNRGAIARNQQRREVLEEQRVIDFEIARRAVQRKKAVARLEEEPYQNFYRESYERRAALMKETRGDQQAEKEAKLKAAALTQSISKAGVTGLWRRMTGRTAREREELGKVNARLEEIAAVRQDRQAALEQDRLQRLEELKAGQQRQREARELALQQTQEQEQQDAMPLARAVGESRTETTRVAQEPEEAAQPEARAGGNAEKPDRKASRREFFRRQAIKRQQDSGAANDDDTADSAGDMPEAQDKTATGREFRQAAELKPQEQPEPVQQQPPAPAPEPPPPDPRQAEYQRRLEVYHQQAETPTQGHSHDSGPQREL